VNASEANARGPLRRHFSRLVTIGAVLLVLALLAYGLQTTASDTRVDERLVAGEAPLAPTFDLPVLETGTIPSHLERRLQAGLGDQRLSLKELSGIPFVLNLWASWCDPCREEAPILENGWRRDGRKGILYLGLNMQDLTGDARGFLDEFNITYPTIRDQGNEVARSYGATGIPETYFISARGRIVGHVVGVVSPKQLANGATASRKGRVVGKLTGGARKSQR
jgi:cytochrome c biogenesis protein CcmG, thiol:disulfide interchange protein DsbE